MRKSKGDNPSIFKATLEDIGIPKLTPEQVETLCETAEGAARKHILSKVPSHKTSEINITVDIVGLKPITVNVDLEIVLSPLMRGYDVQKLAGEAKEKAFSAIEKSLREFACKSKK